MRHFKATTVSISASKVSPRVVENRLAKRRCPSIGTFKLNVETLEQRALLSASYSYDVIAQSGVGNFTGFGTGPSINDDGIVAYVGKHQVGDGLFIKPAGGTSKEISPSFDNDSSRTFMQTVQINDKGQVAAQARVVGATLKSFIELWNSASTDSYTTAATGDSGGNAQFSAVFPFPTTNNSGQTAFGVLNGSTRSLATPTKTIAAAGVLMPMIADNGNIIVRAGSAANSPITLYNNSLGVVQIVADSSMGFTTLGGAPGVSDDGKVVVFAGDRGKGQGIFARFLNGSTWGAIVTIAGENGTTAAGAGPELGFDDAGKNVFFSSFSMDTRVGVVHKELGVTGMVGDSVDVSFIGTPSANGSTNTRTGLPMLFTNKLGLWTTRVNMDTNLNSLAGALVVHPAGSLVVAQVGDKIGGQTITGLGVNDPISLATTDAAGKSRVIRPGDHRVAFYATTSSGSMIVRATHLDSDEDGLLDHWEAAGGGIDINGDGVGDLNLSLMGANLLKRDLFMEIDWTTPRTTGNPYSNEPPAGAIHQLVNMFANAPALSDGIVAGVTLHVDGGSGKDKGGNPFSVNMGGGSLQGGNLITMAGSNLHPDAIYFGINGSQSTPGVNQRSLADVKKNYFGNDSKNARELAFHYSVLADAWGTMNKSGGLGYNGIVKAADATSIDATATFPQLRGGILLITSGKGVGQFSNVTNTLIDGSTGNAIFDVSTPWKVIPDVTSKFAILSGSTGNSEVSFYGSPDFNGVSGNDTIISMGGIGPVNGVLSNTFYTWRTMAHELGHTLGLRHGGIDHNSDKKTAYKSLMSYSYQLESSLTPANQVISYADANAGTFNDWANLQLNFQDSLTSLNNTFQIAAKGASNGGAIELDSYTASQIYHHGYDVTGPVVTFTSPAANAKVAPNGTLTIKATASDPATVASLILSFDINGDGNTTGIGETVIATLSGGVYTATFAKVSGSLTTRSVSALATDGLGNSGITTLAIKIGV
ncbi:MAG: hypothetical protein JWM57_3252 [Phycisphaerales bacterium]|nr:hypothetical protein [Phycisphaerales bacterium]